MNRASFGKPLAALAWLAFGLAVLAAPQAAAQGLQSGLQLCASALLPALFPFFVVCRMAATLPLPAKRLARLCGLQEPCAAAVLPLAWLGGYAVCARLVADLRRSGRIGARDAALLMQLGCCSGPGFVIGSVGGLLLGNVRLGVLLYLAQLAANWVAAWVCRPLLPPAGPHTAVASFATPGVSLPEAISDAVTSCLQVCGCVVFFRLAGSVVLALLPPLPLAGPILSTICEISAGCADWAALGGRAALYGCCACLSLLGASVWAQLRLLLRGTVPLRVLAAGRLVHMVALAVLVRLLAGLLPGTVAVAGTAARTVLLRRMPPDALCVGWAFLCAALYKLQKSIYNEE